MADTSLIQQVGKTIEYGSSSDIVTEVWIGDEDEIATQADTYRAGAKYTTGSGQAAKTGLVRTSKSEKIQSDKAKWTLVYEIKLPDPGGGQGEPEPITEFWSENVVQYQYPLEKYLDPTDAARVAEWEDKDPEAKAAAVDKDNPDGSLTGRALDIARLKFAGTEEVIRCYPQATRVRIFDDYKSSIDPELNTSDDTDPDDQFEWEEEMSWLKVTFDWEQQADGTWQLTESWIGAPESDGGWNAGLYKDWDFYNPDAE